MQHRKKVICSTLLLLAQSKLITSYNSIGSSFTSRLQFTSILNVHNDNNKRTKIVIKPALHGSLKSKNCLMQLYGTVFDEDQLNTEIDDKSLGAYLVQKSKEVQEQIEEQVQRLGENLTQDESYIPSKNITRSDLTRTYNSSTLSSILDLSDINEVQLQQLESSLTAFPSRETALKDTKILTSKTSVVIPHRAATSYAPTSNLTKDSLSGDKKERISTSVKNKHLPLHKRLFRGSIREINIKLSEKKNQEKEKECKFPMGDPKLYRDRIRRDIRYLAVRIASTIESPEQLSLFCKENGGFQPLFECIHEGALTIQSKSYDMADYTRSPSYDLQTKGMLEKEEIFSAACSACKSLRDLCALSPEVASVLTDTALQMDEEKRKNNERKLVDDLVALLKYCTDFEKTNQRISALNPLDNSSSFSSLRRRRALARERRRRCRLHILQLLLAMVVADDEAVSILRSTPDLKDAVITCSSFANLKEDQKKRSFLRFQTLMKFVLPSKYDETNASMEMRTMRMSAPKMGKRKRIRGQGKPDLEKNEFSELESTANKLLAGIGCNIWVPKAPEQKGLRILCLDGGGTRGVTALGSLKAIVDALDGLEPYDAFDMIVGTSTGGIIAFLIGLRLESSDLTKERYDTLVKRIFVKSALATPMLVFTTASYDEAHFTDVMKEILGERSMLDSRADPKVPLVFAVSSKMSSTPTQLCLFRNYNYSGGEIPDKFVVDPKVARENLDMPMESYNNRQQKNENGVDAHEKRKKEPANSKSRKGDGPRHPGSFRVLQRIALRASTAAPTFFKPLLISGELYCDGGVGASNPTAVAIHEARNLFPDIPIELVVSLGTGAFEEEINSPKIGWDGIIGQIVDSALDAEQTHHTLQDILGQGGTAQLGKSSVSQTRYYRFNPIIGKPDAFAIDETSTEKLDELTKIATAYMNESEQTRKLNEIKELIYPSKRGKRWRNVFSRN